MIIFDIGQDDQTQCTGCIQQVTFGGKVFVFWPEDKEYAAYRFLFLYGYDPAEYLTKLANHDEFAIEFNIVTPQEPEVVEKTLLQKIWHFWFPPDSEKWPEN